MPGTVLGLYMHHFLKSSTPAYEIRSRLTPCLESKTLRLEEISKKVTLNFSDLHGATSLWQGSMSSIYLALGALYNVTSMVLFSLVVPSSFLFYWTLSSFKLP